MEALLNVLKHPVFAGLPVYLETPFDDEGHKKEILMIKEKIGLI